MYIYLFRIIIFIVISYELSDNLVVFFRLCLPGCVCLAMFGWLSWPGSRILTRYGRTLL